PPPDRPRLRPRPCPLGRRAHLRLAAPPQAAARPLRPPRRDPRSLPRPRLLPRLLPETQELIVIRVLSPDAPAGGALDRSGNDRRRHDDQPPGNSRGCRREGSRAVSDVRAAIV